SRDMRLDFLRALVASRTRLVFFHATAPPEIYTLSLHDALPIFLRGEVEVVRLVELQPVANAHDALDVGHRARARDALARQHGDQDRKSTRLNSSHLVISYAVFCLKKKTSEM